MRPVVPVAPTKAGPVLAVGLVLHVALLVWLVVWKFRTPYVGTGELRAVKLVPFVASEGYSASQTWEVLGNLFVFIPLGVLLGVVATRWSWGARALGIAALSTGFELAQYVLAVGSSDTTDVIMNTAGGVIGLLVARVSPRAARVLAWVCIVATVAVAFMMLTVSIGPTPTLRQGIPG